MENVVAFKCIWSYIYTTPNRYMFFKLTAHLGWSCKQKPHLAVYNFLVSGNSPQVNTDPPQHDTLRTFILYRMEKNHAHKA